MILVRPRKRKKGCSLRSERGKNDFSVIILIGQKWRSFGLKIG